MITHLLAHLCSPQSVLQSSSGVMEGRKVWEQSGTCSFQGLMNGVGVLQQLNAGSFFAGWLEKLRQVVEGPGVLLQY